MSFELCSPEPAAYGISQYSFNKNHQFNLLGISGLSFHDSKRIDLQRFPAGMLALTA